MTWYGTLATQQYTKLYAVPKAIPSLLFTLALLVIDNTSIFTKILFVIRQYCEHLAIFSVLILMNSYWGIISSTTTTVLSSYSIVEHCSL